MVIPDRGKLLAYRSMQERVERWLHCLAFVTLIAWMALTVHGWISSLQG